MEQIVSRRKIGEDVLKIRGVNLDVLRENGMKRETESGGVKILETFRESYDSTRPYVGLETVGLLVIAPQGTVDIKKMAPEDIVFKPFLQMDPRMRSAAAYYKSGERSVSYDWTLPLYGNLPLTIIHEIGHTHQDSDSSYEKAVFKLWEMDLAQAVGMEISKGEAESALKTIANSERDAWRFTLKTYRDLLRSGIDVAPEMNSADIQNLISYYLHNHAKTYSGVNLALGEDFVNRIFTNKKNEI